MKVKSKFINSEHDHSKPKFKKGDLVLFDPNLSDGGLGCESAEFVVLVTTTYLDPNNDTFCGVVIYKSKQVAWEIGHYYANWPKSTFRDCPVGSFVTMQVKK